MRSRFGSTANRGGQRAARRLGGRAPAPSHEPWAQRFSPAGTAQAHQIGARLTAPVEEEQSQRKGESTSTTSPCTLPLALRGLDRVRDLLCPRPGFLPVLHALRADAPRRGRRRSRDISSSRSRSWRRHQRGKNHHIQFDFFYRLMPPRSRGRFHRVDTSASRPRYSCGSRWPSFRRLFVAHGYHRGPIASLRLRLLRFVLMTCRAWFRDRQWNAATRCSSARLAENDIAMGPEPQLMFRGPQAPVAVPRMPRSLVYVWCRATSRLRGDPPHVAASIRSALRCRSNLRRHLMTPPDPTRIYTSRLRWWMDARRPGPRERAARDLRRLRALRCGQPRLGTIDIKAMTTTLRRTFGRVTAASCTLVPIIPRRAVRDLRALPRTFGGLAIPRRHIPGRVIGVGGGGWVGALL